MRDLKVNRRKHRTDILENLLKRSPNSYGKFESQRQPRSSKMYGQKKMLRLFDYTQTF